MKTTLILFCMLATISVAGQDLNKNLKLAGQSLKESNALAVTGIGLGIFGAVISKENPKTGSIMLIAASATMTISVFKHRSATKRLIEHQKQF